MTKLKRGFKKAAVGTAGLVLGLTAFAPLASAEQDGQPAQHRAQGSNTYHARLQPLNNSGVTGEAVLVHGGHQLGVAIEAEGLTPNQVHPQHIHGKDHPEVAFCPTTEGDDANGDGFLSVIEGAPDYGPIKLNLTDPQTPFGPPPTDALFFPFAGTPDNNNFPTADADGNVSFDGSYTFDMNDPLAAAAHKSLTPLTDQHIVLHGAMAPASVDAPAFEALGLDLASDPNAEIYDPLLPVACGQIVAAQDGEGQAPVTETPVQEVPAVDDPTNVPAEDEANIGTGGQEETVITTAPAQTAAVIAVAAFRAELDANAAELEAKLAEAEATFAQALEDGTEPAVARDRYIAAIQAARDMYVRDFFEARNAMVDQLNRTGDTELRNQVMAEEEAELNEFTQEFEQLKNEVNDLVNNHNRS